MCSNLVTECCYVEGKQKLAERWELCPYVVVKKQPGTPVYVVHSEAGDRERLIHRNFLTQCMFCPVENSHPTQEESDTEEMCELESKAFDAEEVDLETTKEEESGAVTQSTCMDSSDVVEKESEEDVSKSQETVSEKERHKEQTPLKDSATKKPEWRYPEWKRHPPNRLSLEMHVLQS